MTGKGPEVMGFTTRYVGEQKCVLRTDFEAEKYGNLVGTCSLLPRTWDDFFSTANLEFSTSREGNDGTMGCKITTFRTY
jgi:hypothetical protein